MRRILFSKIFVRRDGEDYEDELERYNIDICME